MSNPLKRIKDYIDFKGINISAFEKSAGFSNGLFGGQLKRNRSIGIDKLENILKVYPDLNPNWVLTGRESMLLDPSDDMDTEWKCRERQIAHMLRHNHDEVIASLNNIVAAQQQTITMLEQLIKQNNGSETTWWTIP